MKRPTLDKVTLPNVEDDRRRALQALFPEVISDGRVNLSLLAELLGDEEAALEGGDQPFGLYWPGKLKARKLAAQAPQATLRRMPGLGVDEDKTGNLLIVGDNLQVLKALQKSYMGSVKLIYIDPPYNTGSDFIYNDSFAVEADEYLKATGQADDEGLLTNNPESNGRFHSRWLTMMYPRLVVAHRLLREDGFLVVSIDDAEQAALKLMLDALFGAENFLATLVWDRNRKNDAKFFSVGHEYMLVYAKSKGQLQEDKTVLRAPKEGVEEVRALFESLRKEHGDDWEQVRLGLKAFFTQMHEDDPRKPLARYNLVDADGPFEKGNLNWPGSGGPKYEVLHPKTGKPCKVPISGWRLPNPGRFQEEARAGRIVFGPDETTTPRAKVLLFNSTTQVLGSVAYSYAQNAAQRFDALFDNQRVFDNPKPFDDLAGLIHYLCGPDDLVMDFFAGSGSTGHGVWLANQKYGTHRRFVLVQLGVAVNDDVVSGRNALALGLNTLDAITRERLKRVSAQMKREDQPADLGFRVYHQAPPALVRPAHLPPEALGAGPQGVLSFTARRDIGRPSDELHDELLLLLGYPLDAARGRLDAIPANVVWRFHHPRVPSDLLVCLDPQIDEDLEGQLLDWCKGNHEDPGKGRYPVRFVCRDEALDDTVAQRLHDLPIALQVL